jgi:hypothetical protein
MKTKLFLLVAIMVVFFTGGWVGYAQKESTRWEYTVIHTSKSGDLQDQLNNLGLTSWQLVSVTEVNSGNPGQTLVTLYLKRARM